MAGHEAEANIHVLPENVKPVRYTLRLKPDLQKFTFDGVAVVELEVVKESSEIKFHGAELEIKAVVLETAGGSLAFDGTAAPLPVSDAEAETVTLNLPQGQKLSVGPAKLTVTYTGIHNTNMAGFYRSDYTIGDEKRVMVTTQFEATDARRAFPCWDEPARKATFDVTLVVPSELTALSNMPVVSEVEAGDGSKEVKFAESPVMSTYLVAFIVGELEALEGRTKEGVLVRIFTTPGKREQGRFALDVAARVLSFFNSYFGIDYPLPKSDLVAIPDFAMGAMENWGLVTFRETALLCDENTAAASRQRIAYVISHELAHQWFGNLVTMQWWNDLWLNEGFATWVGVLGMDHCFPEWDSWTQFTSNEMTHALATDSLLSSHPIEIPIKDPKEINQVFDALSYQKGACVIRMLHAAIGAEAFQKGLHMYLSSHKYANSVTSDLWAALSEGSGQPVQSMMDSWTAQVGYPLVTVTEGPEGSGSGLRLRQSRFLSMGPPTEEQDRQLWWIPVTAAEGGAVEPATRPIVVLKEKEQVTNELRAPSSNGWLKLNPGQTGIYRVNYPPHLWAALAGAVKSLAIPAVDRLGVVGDAFALATAGLLPTSQALELMMAYTNETDYTVWNQVSSGFGDLATILTAAPDLISLLDRVGCQLYEGIAEEVGWDAKEGESHLVGLLRPLVFGSLAQCGHNPTVAECKKRFESLTKDTKSVHPDLRLVVMSSAVRTGGQAEYDAVKALFNQASSADMKMKCVTAMGQSPDPAIIRSFIDFGMNSGAVRNQDVIYVLRALTRNRFGRDILWDYFKENWTAIYGKFKAAQGLLRYVACTPISAFASEERADEIVAFFTDNPVPEAAMGISRAIESVRSNGKWLTRDKSDIAAWLQKTAGSGASSLK